MSLRTCLQCHIVFRTYNLKLIDLLVSRKYVMAHGLITSRGAVGRHRRAQGWSVGEPYWKCHQITTLALQFSSSVNSHTVTVCPSGLRKYTEILVRAGITGFTMGEVLRVAYHVPLRKAIGLDRITTLAIRQLAISCLLYKLFHHTTMLCD